MKIQSPLCRSLYFQSGMPHSYGSAVSGLLCRQAFRARKHTARIPGWDRNLPAQGKKTLKINLSSEKSDKKYEPRVYAEMLVSDKKGKHVPVHSVTIPGNVNIYNQMHHHGPAFESELVAYRLYFDHKQTVDSYGKFNKGFESKESQFYPTDEQLARGFGDDVLRVSGSCGVGALKSWNGKKAMHIEPVSTLTESIIAYGPVRTIAEIKVTDWEYQGSLLNLTTPNTL